MDRNENNDRISFPDKKKQDFQDKFAMLLNNQNLENLDGNDFGFDHQFSDQDENENIDAQQYDDNHEEYQSLGHDYNEKLMDLKNNYSQFSKTNGHLEITNENYSDIAQNQHQEYQPNSEIREIIQSYTSNNKQKHNNRENNPISNFDDLNVIEIQSIHQHPNDRPGTNTKNIDKSNREPSKQTNEQHSFNKSEKTISKEQNLYPTFVKSKLSKSSLSAYKKHMIFSGKINLNKMEFGIKKSGMLKFDIEYEKNVIPARREHEINGFICSFKEQFEVPFKTLYDRRKKQFICEPLKINVMNIHKKYNKKLGYALLSISNILNKQLVYYNGPLKLQKSSDRNAKLHLRISLKFETFTDKDKNFERKSNYHFDESYFSWKTER